MRTAFIDQLIKEARINDKVFLVVGDLGFSVVEPFAQEFPDRFLNAGVAEQNMAGVAAGLAMDGYNVFIYSIGNFPTLRCMEQIRYDICYHKLNVKIVAVGAGYAYGSLGPSHHATEEMGMLRVIPNISVVSPGDPVEARIATTMLANYDGPAYLRLGKAGEKQVHPDSLTFNWGDVVEVVKGTRTAVLCTGSILSSCYRQIKEQDLKIGLYSVPFIKPTNQQQLADIFNHYDQVISIEEHQKIGGLGSMLLESANDLRNLNLINHFPKIEIRAINNLFYSKAGTQDFLRKEMGLTI